jgi:hypothetical protein
MPLERILEGNLARFEVPDLLTLLSLGRHTGVLVLERSKPEQETKVFFKEGQPAYATSTKPDLKLGALAVRLGKIQAGEVERLLSRGMGQALPIGRILVDEKVLLPQELEGLLRQQVAEVVFDTFEWRAGSFYFLDKVPPPATAVALELDLSNLIMEGVRRIDERARIDEIFPDRKLIVESVANPERVRQSSTFTPEEWDVYFLVDGRRSIEEICAMNARAGDVETLDVLRRLVAANIVALRRSATAATRLPTLEAVPGEGAPGVNAAAVVFARTERPTARLVYSDVSGETSFPLVRESSILGRHRNCDVLLSDAKVSAYHARVDCDPHGWSIVDLRSRNGTLVNGQRIQRASLKDGDVITVGLSRLVLRVDPGRGLK